MPPETLEQLAIQSVDSLLRDFKARQERLFDALKKGYLGMSADDAKEMRDKLAAEISACETLLRPAIAVALGESMLNAVFLNRDFDWFDHLFRDYYRR